MAAELVQEFRVCRKCGERKPATVDHFNKKLEGLTSQCRPCRNASKRLDWACRAAGLNAERRASRDETTRRKDREYYRANAERKARQARERHAADPERRRSRERQQYAQSPDKKRQQAAEWAARNPERYRANMREFYRRKRQADPMYRLRSSVSAYVYWCLRSGKGGRRTEELLGYSIATLRLHLERQFERGMTWDNYGEWHVDHILPVASFNFTSPDDPDFRACWAMTNLRPMWAADNIRKSDKRLYLI
jgi:hypothetical protein